MKPLLIAGLLVAGFAAHPGMAATIRTDVWDTLPDNRPVHRFTMRNASGSEVSVMELGAAVTAIRVPDRGGKIDDVVLGYDTPIDYITNNGPQFGLVIGRYANRIVTGKFSLGGTEHKLATQGRSDASMHGGPQGFGTRLWSGKRVRTPAGEGVRMTLVSPDGDQGFPGKMVATVTYVWTADDRLIIDYTANTTKPTVVNLTQHSYFNLAGAGNGDVLKQTLKLDADYYMDALPNNTPTGEIRAVKGTPFDFSQGKPIGQDIAASDPHMVANRGYNVQYVLRSSPIPGEAAPAATMTDPQSGRTLKVLTTEPGVMLYTANFINTDRLMKNGVKYPLRAGAALEMQHFPDSPNRPHFPRTMLMPGQVFNSRTVWEFTHS
ncbi:aldose epimerase family protein [Glacieibacterium sp.]|uniref:aldose epimerase family protein n=1 Tax=Glacieibacterium sp. TaxID=2860237 RepID=UPI003AFF716E